MNLVAMPCEPVGKPLSLLTTYGPSPSDPYILRTVRKLLTSTGLISGTRDYRSHLGNLAPFRGSTWWALSREACEHVRAFVDTRTRVVNFFRHTVCPDESFFHTILGNSPYRGQIRKNLTFTDWSGGGANPAHITEKHLPFLTAAGPVILDDRYGKGEILFARKFSDESEEIVRRLERSIEAKAPSPPAGRTAAMRSSPKSPSARL